MSTSIPQDPLARFLAIAEALVAEKRFWDDRSIVRYAALPLVVASGEPKAVALRAAKAAAAVAEGTGWFSDLRGALRFVLAALLAAAEKDAAQFGRSCEQLRERFRKAGVRPGGAHEIVAAVMLHLTGADSEADVQRMQRIYTMMKGKHWWLTGPEDLPACALLAVQGDESAAMPARIEAIYQRLHQSGLRAGSGLQLASHVLYLAPGSEAEVSGRFLELHQGFKAAGIQMWDCDRDELALLCLLGEDPKATIARVHDHRAQIKKRLSHVGPVTSFSYACGTAFLAAHAGATLDDKQVRNVRVANLLMAMNAASVLQQQKQSAATTSAISTSSAV
jgi:hypothetical protein